VTGIKSVLKAFRVAVGLLRRGRPAAPLAVYFLLKTAVVLLYARDSSGAAAHLWRALRPGPGAEALSHYPDRLIAMPAVLGRLDIPLEILVLSFAQGATVLLVALAARGERLSLRAGAARARSRYVHLAVSAAIVSAALFAVFRLSAALLHRIAAIPRAWELGIGISAGLVVQAIFIYAVPFVMLEGRSSIDAVKRSVMFAGRHFVESLALVAVPFAVTVPTLLLALNPRAIAFQLSPEFLVQSQIAGAFMEFAAGYLLMGSLTIYVLDTRMKEEKR
jgi:hypothetical protein